MLAVLVGGREDWVVVGVLGLVGAAVAALILALFGQPSPPAAVLHTAAPRAAGRVPAVRTKPERILIWVAILCLTMFLLVPGCLVGLGLLVPMLAQQKAKTAAVREHAEARQAQKAAVEAAKSRSRSEKASVVVPEGGTIEVLPATPLEAPMQVTSRGTEAAGQNRTAANTDLPPGVRWATEPEVNNVVGRQGTARCASAE